MTRKALLFILLLLPFSTFATPVGPMNYQGRLLDNMGVPVTGVFNFVVRIYDDPVAGVLKYSEEHNGVAVDDGVYSFKVGLGTNPGGDSQWDIDLWQGNLNDLYMELEVNGETLTPRQELTSAPHAFTATLALSANSLGAKTAAQYDNILQGICEVNKSRWIDSLSTCIGAGSSFTGQSAATAGTNWANLDLRGADLSGTDFTGADFSNTDLTGATLSANLMSGVNFTGARLDNVTTTGAISGAVNLTDTFIKNTDLTGWNLGSATVTGLSGGSLIACPSALPANWACRPQYDDNAVTYYMLMGPGANFSTNSAVVESEGGIYRLRVTRAVGYGFYEATGYTLTNTNFAGLSIENLNFAQNNFTGATFRQSRMANLIITNPNFTNADFSYSHWINTEVRAGPTLNVFNGTIFQNAYVENTAMRGYDKVWEGFPGFYNTVFNNVQFQGEVKNTGGAGYLSFDDCVLSNVLFNALSADNITMTNVVIRGKLEVGKDTSIASMTGSLVSAELVGNFTNVAFQVNNRHSVLSGDFTGATFHNYFLWEGGTLSGNFTNVWFDDMNLYRFTLTGNFTNAQFTNNHAASSSYYQGILYSTFDGNFTGATFNQADFDYDATVSDSNVYGSNMTCPNGSPPSGIPLSCAGMF